MTMKMMRRASYKGPSGGPDLSGFLTETGPKVL